MTPKELEQELRTKLALRARMRNLRFCFVDVDGDKTPACFHHWAVTSALPEGASAYGVTKGIVEYADGEVELVDPWEIQFAD